MFANGGVPLRDERYTHACATPCAFAVGRSRLHGMYRGRPLALAWLALTCAHAPRVAAQALRVDPPQVVLSDSARVGQLTVTNRTHGAVDVRVDALVYTGVCADSHPTRVDLPPADSSIDAADLLRFAPTRFRLDSGAAQLVRLARVSRTAGLEQPLQLALVSRRAPATRLIIPDSNARFNELGTSAVVRVPVCLRSASGARRAP
jgi:hypothetical protein